MNAEDSRVAEAIAGEAEAIAQAVEVVAGRLRRGGRLIYLGAGTSGRLGVLDAAECPPTFNSPPEQVVGLIAGGPSALVRAVEGAEDRREAAAADLQAVNLNGNDVVLGIATSGRTPYVLAGLEHARRRGAFTIGLSCNRDAELASHADLTIAPVVGPEVLSGSTRLKAGTATKMVLNMITTGAMVLLGKTYGNLMVDLRATNRKLRERSRRIVSALAGLSPAEADRLLARCDGEVKTAVVAHLGSIPPDEARQRLARSGGHLRGAIDGLASPPPEGTAASGELVLGVDGGGSKTIAWLARQGGAGEATPLGRGTAGPSNPQAVGFALALENLDRAIAAAFSEAAIDRGTLAAAVLALAGSDRDENRRVLHRWAEDRRLARRVEIVHDAAAVLAAGTSGGWGVALIAGTGSFSFGETADGRSARAGGWGFLMGDEGGGYALALAGLRAAARAADGRGPATALVAGFLERLGLNSPPELVTAVYRMAADRAAIASLAKIVIERADEQDAAALAIVDRAAAELAGLVEAVARKLELGKGSSPFPLALAGGLLTSSPRLRAGVLDRLAAVSLRADPVVPVVDPVRGALKRAAALACAPPRPCRGETA
jgi:N-acetylmuramic acid 6-phosphate etherase